MSSKPQSFNKLAILPELLTTLSELGYERMTPVQAETLPSLLAGRDVIAQAMTGSGKTAAFGISLLNRIVPRDFTTQALVLCPTRELADQVTKALRQYARGLGNIKMLTLCGGMAMGPQLNSLEFGAQVVVGTPGRVLKHLKQGSLSLTGLKTLVLDEADRMLDMGFHASMVDVLEFVPVKRQTLLFSATYSEEVRALSGRFQSNPVEVTVVSEATVSPIEQIFFEVDPKARVAAVTALLRRYQPESAVLFCNTKQRCEEVLTELRAQGFPVSALHGDLEQRDRDLVLVQFANRSRPLLVATDVAARGLDVKDLAAVINVEMAFDPETHVHRIGRTGRAGQTGLALSLCAAAESHRSLAIAEYQDMTPVWQDLPTVNVQSKIPAPRRVTLQINGGRKDKLRPGDVLGALTGEGGVPGAQVGKIDIFDLHSYVAVDREVAPAALRRLAEAGVKGRNFKARVLA
ncbi:MAG: ATP-dependent RNA helicase DbpA [Pseudomonadota bacterium]